MSSPASGEAGGFKKVDNLTPFEYALAGVAIPDSEETPSLAVISHMRQLAAEVEHAPVSQPRLREFLQTGGSIAERNDRRSIRRRRASDAGAPIDVPDEGGFIDITPVELTSAAAIGIESQDEPSLPAAAPVDEATGNGANLGPHHEVDHLDVVHVAIQAELGHELPTPVAEQSQADTPAVPAADAAIENGGIEHAAIEHGGIEHGGIEHGGIEHGDLEDGGPEHVENGHLDDEGSKATQARQPAVPDVADGPAPPVDPTRTSPLPAADPAPAIAAAVLIESPLPEDLDVIDGVPPPPVGAAALDGVAPVTEEPPVVDGVPPVIDEPVVIDGVPPTPGDVPADGQASTDIEDDTLLGHPVEPIAAPAAADEADTAVPLEPALLIDPHPDPRPDLDDAWGLRGQSGRFVEPPMPPAEPVLVPEPDPEGEDERNDDGANLVGAGGTTAVAASAALPGILEGLDATDGPPVAPAAAITGPVPVPVRRVSGAFWALAGTVAAAAALAVGGLWWTSSLSSETDTEAAASPQVADEPDTEAGGGDGTDGDGPGSEGRSPGSTDRSDSQTTEFGSRATSATATSTTTPSTRPRRTTASANLTTTTGGRRSLGPIPSTDGQPGEQSTTAGSDAASTSLAPSTTQPPVTDGQTTSRPATTPAPTSPPAPGFIGDLVTIDSFDGPTVSGMLVELYDDRNGDGNQESLVNSTRTEAGRYGFEAPAGCYVVRFYAPDGFQVQSGLDRQPVCVDAGGSAARVDAIVSRIGPPAGPSRCVVEWPGNESFLGVEVYENQSNWADSYTFYDDKGKVVARTRDLGSADDVEGPTNREWESEASDFKHKDVYSVAAERGGTESDPVSCTRLPEPDD